MAEAKKGWTSVTKVTKAAPAIVAAEASGRMAHCCSAEFANASARAYVRERAA